MSVRGYKFFLEGKGSIVNKKIPVLLAPQMIEKSTFDLNKIKWIKVSVDVLIKFFIIVSKLPLPKEVIMHFETFILLFEDLIAFLCSLELLLQFFQFCVKRGGCIFKESILLMLI